uniref:Uncharacterized protein n=1 Tax=Cynoglossus semilaevis TaxID=244447 RepID=A0A3P8WEF5_CYNSE
MKYNGEGDLLFSVANDPVANVWYTGAVRCIDCDLDTKNVLTGSAVDCGTVRFQLQHHHVFHRLADGLSVFHELLRPERSTDRCCQYSGEVLKKVKETSRRINDIQTSVDLTMFNSVSKDNTTKVRFQLQHHHVFHKLADGLSVFHELLRPERSTDRCCQYSGEVLKKVKETSRRINDIQTSVDLTMFNSVSKDNTTKLFDSASLDHIETFKTERR